MISVVIPAYNEEKNIGQCLDSLIKQKTKHKYEVIIVDNASTDKTKSIALSYNNRLDLRVIFEKQKGRGAARESGFRNAKGEIILSTDADTIVPENWMERLSSELLKENAIAVTGFCKIKDLNSLNNFIANTFQPMMIDTYRLVTGHNCLSGFNFGILKNNYKKTNGFNRNLNSSEDIDLSVQLSKFGKIKLLRDLFVIVSGRRFKKGMIRQALPYFTLFIRYYFFKDKNLILSDVR